MLKPDLDIGRRFVKLHQAPGKLLLCALTGAHHYGFPSPDSDLDLKAIHLAPTQDFLGLEKPVETQDKLEDFEGVECDFTSHEAKKALKLLLAGNGNILERILSPYQLFNTQELIELQNLAHGALSKRFAKHYQGYLKSRCREHEKSSKPKAKTMLYSYRVALTGIHLMRTQQLEANLSLNAVTYGFEEVLELIEFKKAHGEKCVPGEALDKKLRARWKDLDQMLETSTAQSPLPETALNRQEISHWLRVKRMEFL